MALKRVYAVLAAALLAACVAMSGCAKGDTEPVRLDGQCGFEAQITKGDDSFEVIFQRAADGSWAAVFSAPDAVDGMSVTSSGDCRFVTYQGLSLEIAAEKLPSWSVIEAIEQCMDHAASSSSVKTVEDGDMKLVKGNAACGEYELRVTNGGEPVSLYIGSELCAELTGFERQEQ